MCLGVFSECWTQTRRRVISEAQSLEWKLLVKAITRVRKNAEGACEVMSGWCGETGKFLQAFSIAVGKPRAI